MKPEDDDWDEALFSSLIHSTDREMPPPDPQFLADLRERSTRAFLESAAANASGSPGDAARSEAPASPSTAVPQTSPPSRYPHGKPTSADAPPPRKRTMLSLAFKAVSACV